MNSRARRRTEKEFERDPMPTDDEPSRKKRGAENQLTQNNWDGNEDDSGDMAEGEFKKAPEEELAKRKIIKARRSCKTGAVGGDGSENAVEKSQSAATAPFSWTASVQSAGNGDNKKEEDAPAANSGKDGEKRGEGPAKESKDESKDGAEKAAAKDNAAPSVPEKKALFSFPSAGTTGFGSFTGFGTGGFAGFGTTGAFGAGTSSAFGSTAFGSFGSAPSFSFSFSNAPTQVDAFKAVKKDGGEEGEEGDDGAGGGEDVEKEVVVEKTCQLEEVEVCTGEEDETTVFQVRGKLFIFCAPQAAARASGGPADKEPAQAAKGKDEDVPLPGSESSGAGSKEGKSSWVVIGIGNLRLNIPKEGCTDKSRRPRIVMRRQKTFQVCLNTYLFESMVCDKAGPKDIRFTGMRMDVENGTTETELATYLLRVKEEEQADEFVALVHKHKNCK